MIKGKKSNFVAKYVSMGLLFFSIGLCLQTNAAFAHCQVPCGIYDDKARFHEMLEHVETIRKARNMIVSLESPKEGEKVNYNQIVRWVNTKEEHASKIQNIISEYFLTQKIKLNAKKKKRTKYLDLCHKILVHAMKCKQSLDQKYYDDLKNNINEFKELFNRKK